MCEWGKATEPPNQAPWSREAPRTDWIKAFTRPRRILSSGGPSPPLPPLPPLHAIIGLTATRCCVACAAIGLAISAEAPPSRDKSRIDMSPADRDPGIPDFR